MTFTIPFKETLPDFTCVLDHLLTLLILVSRSIMTKCSVSSGDG